MGKKSAPKAPDYKAAAEAQGASSLALTDKQTKQNRPDLVTPWGTQTWQQDPTDKDRWTQTTTLSPEEQSALDSQQRIQEGRSQGAETLLGQAVQGFQTPMNWDNLPQRSGMINAPEFADGPNLDPNVANQGFNTGRGVTDAFSFGNRSDPAQIRNQAQEAVWQMQKPALDQRREGVEVQLANQGLARGSEAWNREMQRLDDGEDRARLSAIDAGRAEAGQIFGQDATRFGQGLASVDQANRVAGQEFSQNLGEVGFENQAQQQEFDNTIRAAMMGDQRAMQQLQAQLSVGGFNNTNRQGAVTEESMRRGQTLNELNALLTGQQVNMPTMPGFNNATKADAVGYSDAARDQYSASLDAYNAKQAGMGSLVSGLGSAAMMFSDARLKEDISYAGASIGGVPVVYFRYRGLPGLRIGVIAQDVLKVRPSAVAMHASGFLMVNYQELCS